MEWIRKNDDFLRSRKTIVPPKGPTNAKLAYIGEQPGRQETHQRKPFVGPAGRELDKCSEQAKLNPLDGYYSNVVKDLDLPLKAYIDIPDKMSKDVIVTPLGLQYIEILKQELEEIKPNVVVAVGGVALFALCARRGINNWRSSILESTLVPGLKVIPTLHPATIIPPKNVYLNKHLITADLDRARDQSKFTEIILKPRRIFTKPSFLEAVGYIDEAIKQGLEGKTIFYDIELASKDIHELSCISISWDEQEGMSIPFTEPGRDYFTADQELQIMLKLAQLLEDPRIRKGGQNLAFDSHLMLRNYGIKMQNPDGLCVDTMVTQKTLYPDFPVRLEFSTAMFTDVPYYKADGKVWLKGVGSFERGWEYNGLDSVVCVEIDRKQKVDVSKLNNKSAVERQTRLIPPLTYMMERGIRVDTEGMKRESESYLRRIEEAREELWSLAGYELNHNSPPQLIEYFYNKKGYTPYRNKKTKSGYSTNDNALKGLIRKGCKEAEIIQRLRTLTKNRSTYLNLDKVDTDGRLRCAYNPSGTRYSRLSSSKNIFGTGMNQQNWPHELLAYLLPDEGYLYYSFDLSQIENRIVAYTGPVPQMIEAFEKGLDLHRLTAALIFSKPYDDVTTEDGTCALGNGSYSERFWGKKGNHAFNYDLGYKSFALTYELPESEGKWITERYHLAYPGVRNNYHQGVRMQLAKTRTLTNLMGRTTLFMDQWSDKLFKEAYSCIPQGTTGDVINERGVNYIYYNQQHFAPIELLNQVHDSVGFQVPLSTPWQHVASMLLMIKESLETPLSTSDGRQFVVPSDLTISNSLRKEDGFELKSKEIPGDINRFAQMLEEKCGGLLDGPAT